MSYEILAKLASLHHKLFPEIYMILNWFQYSYGRILEVNCAPDRVVVLKMPHSPARMFNHLKS